MKKSILKPTVSLNVVVDVDVHVNVAVIGFTPLEG
jgi:hypothetical protein